MIEYVGNAYTVEIDAFYGSNFSCGMVCPAFTTQPTGGWPTFGIHCASL